LLACGPDAPLLPRGLDGDQDGWAAPVDCDDSDASRYPGARDVPYDGIDGDCLGGDDYDADRDGHAWTRYGGLDCDDNNPAVSPDQAEVRYDFLDNDCDPSTADADADADGVTWPSDCDDEDPARYPGAVEVLGDGVDSDCGDDGDGSTLQVWPGVMEGPADPRLVGFDGAVALVLRLSRWVDPSGAEVHQPAMLWLDVDQPTAAPHIWHNAEAATPDDADTVYGVDAASANETLYLAIAARSHISDRRNLLLEPHVRGALSLIRLNGPTVDLFFGDDLTHVEAAIDAAGVGWVATSGPNDLAWADDLTERSLPADGTGGVVLGGGTLTTCDAQGACADRDLLGGEPTSRPDVLAALRERDGLRLVRGPAGAEAILPDGTRAPLFPGEVVRDADLVDLGDRWFGAAIIDADDGPEAWITWANDDDGLWSTAQLQAPDNLLVTEVGVWSDGASALVVVAGHDRLGQASSDRLLLARWSW
jgi:hypothetical protein